MAKQANELKSEEQAAPAAQAAVTPAPAPAPETYKVRVLLVEDNADMLRLMGDILSGMGHAAMSASNGRDALKLLLDEKPDVVITDHRMAGLTGLELLREARKRGCEAEFVVVTAFEERDLIVECVRQRASGFIRKPFNLQEFRDATAPVLERARLRLENQRLEERLKAAARLSEMGKTVAAIVHELRTPLTYVKGSVHLVSRIMEAFLKDGKLRARDVNGISGAEAETMLRESCADAERGCKLLESIIGSYRRFAAQTGKLERVPLAELVREAVLISRHDADKSVRVVTELDSAAPEVECKPLEIVQVLVNLLKNAYRASLAAPAPTVEISTSARVGTDGLLAEIAVQDNGPGVQAEKRGEIFGDFVTGASDGLGLGLGISRRIATGHGGEILVEDSRLGGAKFVLLLPAAEN